MRSRVAAILMGLVAAALAIGLWPSRHSPLEQPPAASESNSDAASLPSATNPPPVEPVAASEPEFAPPVPKQIVLSPPPGPDLEGVTNKLERLDRIRDYFRKLAAGDRGEAMRAAKGMIGTERETALLALVTEWTQGNLRDPAMRAWTVTRYGLDAAMGMELARDPDLALQWAHELTAGSGRAAVIGEVAANLVVSDPVRAFSLSDEIPEKDREAFYRDVFGRWAARDTQAALDWADQLPDPAGRDTAISAIRTTAPVGIGAALRMQDGYPAIDNLVAGGPAELSGQLQKGDRIVGVAQGDSAFIDAHGMTVSDIVKLVRGDPGTTVQLQVLASDAPAGSAPRTVTVIRDQVKFKMD